MSHLLNWTISLRNIKKTATKINSNQNPLKEKGSSSISSLRKHHRNKVSISKSSKRYWSFKKWLKKKTLLQKEEL